MNIVLQKFIADSGFCSRRQAEVFIREGRVSVNGEKAGLGARVSEEDMVKIGNKTIGLAPDKIYIKLNKPRNYTCTNKSFINEQNVFDLVRIDERLFVVGRLDKDSRGLVLLTNDGELTQRMTHPKFEHEKKYVATITNDKLSEKEISALVKRFKSGVDIGGEEGLVRAKDMRHLAGNKFEVILTEGRKRQIRRMFGELGFDVVDLVRTEIGSLKLGNLEEGAWEYLKKEEIKSLTNL